MFQAIKRKALYKLNVIKVIQPPTLGEARKKKQLQARSDTMILHGRSGRFLPILLQIKNPFKKEYQIWVEPTT